MNMYRYPAAFVSLVVVLALELASALSSVSASGTLLLQGTLTPTAFLYLPYVAKQYPPPPTTPTATLTNTLTSTPTSTATPTNTPTSTPTPTATLQVTPAPGHWTGTTSRAHPMAFDVSADSTQWNNFMLRTSGQVGPCSVTITTTVSGPGAITNNQFSWSSSTYSFSGQFTSSTTANGVYAYTNDYFYGCGYFNQTGTWTANKP